MARLVVGIAPGKHIAHRETLHCAIEPVAPPTGIGNSLEPCFREAHQLAVLIGYCLKYGKHIPDLGDISASSLSQTVWTDILIDVGTQDVNNIIARIAR